jgi:Asp-tRNA(Asn)/Glu-tRNA(Gln) amidotransferase A subunit family amidase
VREEVDESLRAGARENPRLNAFITVTEEAARAVELDAMLARGVDLGPLHGIPIAHKDCILTKGVRTTGGSKIFADYVPRRDADVVERLHAAGAVTIGKTGLHELTYARVRDGMG